MASIERQRLNRRRRRPRQRRRDRESNRLDSRQPILHGRGPPRRAIARRSFPKYATTSAAAKAGSTTKSFTAGSARTPRHLSIASTNGTASSAAGIPSYLLGADYVKTFNDDKINREVEIRLTISRPAILYILLDKRSPVPDWLRGAVL